MFTVSDAKNWIGAQISMEYEGRTLLGDVYDVEVVHYDSRYSLDSGAEVNIRGEGHIRLHVRYFNGEEWPTSPFTSEVVDLRNRWTVTSLGTKGKIAANELYEVIKPWALRHLADSENTAQDVAAVASEVVLQIADDANLLVPVKFRARTKKKP